MDLFHIGEISVSPDGGSSSGPWTIDGILGRTGDSGNTDLTMWLEIDHSGGMIATQPFSVTFAPSTTQQAWSTSFDDDIVGSLNLEVTKLPQLLTLSQTADLFKKPLIMTGLAHLS